LVFGFSLSEILNKTLARDNFQKSSSENCARPAILVGMAGAIFWKIFENHSAIHIVQNLTE
jgi:hypothetical protein